MNSETTIVVCAWCSPEIKGPNISHSVCELHKHRILVDRVMAIHGRASADPKTYRRILEAMSNAALMRAIEESDFPAQPSLTETAGVIASTDTGTVPDSAREFLLQTALEKLP